MNDWQELVGISRGLAALWSKHWGRGPQRCRAHWAGPDTIVAILSGGHTPAERSLQAAGHCGLVLEARERLHEILEDEMRQLVEEATGRSVGTVLHATHLEPELSAQVFMLRSAHEALAETHERVEESRALHAQSSLAGQRNRRLRSESAGQRGRRRDAAVGDPQDDDDPLEG